jgi:hypothetical protein
MDKPLTKMTDQELKDFLRSWNAYIGYSFDDILEELLERSYFRGVEFAQEMSYLDNQI